MQQPVKYAGVGGQHTIFNAPAPAATLRGALLPGTSLQERAFVVPSYLWSALVELSLWVEALCLHEWSLYIERVVQVPHVTRGEAFSRLTITPAARLPLTWERNQVQLLMLEGTRVRCPWTRTTLTPHNFDLDHLVPVSAYPMNDLWNLLPSDPHFNQHIKRDRLPEPTRLRAAKDIIGETYEAYDQRELLQTTLRRDVVTRFGHHYHGEPLVTAVLDITEHLAQVRVPQKRYQSFCET